MGWRGLAESLWNEVWLSFRVRQYNVFLLLWMAIFPGQRDWNVDIWRMVPIRLIVVV